MPDSGKDGMALGHHGATGAHGLTLRETTIAVAWNLQIDPATPGLLAESQRLFGVMLPLGPDATVSAGRLTVMWLGPASWLLLAGDLPAAGHPLAAWGATRDAINAIGGAVFDVSASRLAWTLEGEKAAQVLATGCPLDFDRRAFPVGGCAQSMFGQVGALFHRPAANTFTLLVARSFAADVASALCAASAQHGYDALPPAPFASSYGPRRPQRS